MRRLAPFAALLCLAFVTGVARADVFEVLPAPALDAGLSTASLPSADVPNIPGLVSMPASIMTPPAQPQQLSRDQLLGIWQRAGAAYDIPWQVLAAINEVESNFGRNMGPSSAGAIGWMQFMPSTWYRWGVDADGDGVADPWNATDAIFSAARYLAAAGGSTDIASAVYSYNHADWYVNEVLGLAKLYGNGTDVAFTLDSLQTQLDTARQALATFGDRLVAARGDATRLESIAARLRARADAATLLSDRLAAEQQAGEAASQAAAAAGRVDTLERSVESARASLARVQAQSAPVSFAAGSEPLLGGPTAIDGYVFPVGGGAGTVSASHSHHDYPAVDIAAPLGAPLYALTDGVVDRSWSTPDPRCGIGFTMRADDGREWTYCHMSVLDTTVVAGAALTAGQPVGLVGATGDATGPHLHLQLQPATTWPQREAWFQAFAGSAFRWQDAAPAGWTTNAVTAVRDLQFSPGTPPAQAAGGPSSGPVFAVVPQPQSGGVVYFRSGP